MSDSFQQGLSDTLPILRQMRDGFRSPPTVSISTLERLKSLQRAAPQRSVAEKPAAAPVPVRTETAPPQARPEPQEWTLDSLREAALICTKCPHLVRSRTQVVFGVGNPHAELMFVGEAPGADEDEQGEPFVGRAGQLLTKIIQAMGFSREQVYIGNVLKCRPDMPKGASGNRKPRPEEMSTCLPWLEKQIELIKPKAMVALGATAIEGLLGNTDPVGRLRGRWLEFKDIPVMTTYHPAYLLRNQSNTEKRKVWEDMLLVLERLGRPISEKQRNFFTKGDA